MSIDTITSYLGDEADQLLRHRCIVPGDGLHLPGPDFIERVLIASDRSPAVLRNMQNIFGHGRLASTGYLSILPVDHGVEHGAGASFAINPAYFDPENILKLAIEGGCNAVASTLGVLGAVARRYTHRIPFIVKINHNELLSYPNKYDQIRFAGIEQAFEMGAVAIGATIYFGSPESKQRIPEISEAFRYAHQLGMGTVLWAYLRNESIGNKEQFQTAADLTGQANHLGVTIEADIVKQKQAVGNGGFTTFDFGKTHEKVYSELTTGNPIDLVRYQVMNCYMGRSGLINSGGASRGKDDVAEVVQTAVINKRAGGMGVITGRKAFQRPINEAIELLHASQDVYLCPEVTIA